MKTALTIIITLAFLGIFTAGPLSMGHGAQRMLGGFGSGSQLS